MSNEHLGRVKELEKQGKFALVAEEYKRRVKLGIGDQADAHQKRGRALARIGRYNEAFDECQKALALDSDLHLAHGVLGDIYLQRAQYDLAEEEYLTALRIKPEDVASLGNLAHIYSRQENYEKAIEMCKKGLQYQPQNPKLRMALAELYRCQSHFREAMEQINEARKASFSFRILFHTVMILVTAVLQYNEKLNPGIRTGISAVIYGVALLAPSFLSIPLGLVVLGFGLVLIFVYPRIYTYKGKEFKVYILFLLYFLHCAFYWSLVFLLRPRLIAWWLSFD